ncbi:phytanoyl-CoA dioxygenase family protein [Paraglaciecola marina]|uniref:phytanoyl-CoA dioxygenase family protein n=1 Tax=Paraglaciecola marina TaxID=2500157 RepID=UPI00105CEE42|nr:phytanoyl-CoA dioxygenase family protein [Paraglaciecola marina]
MNNLEQGFAFHDEFLSQVEVAALIDDLTLSDSNESMHGVRNAEKKFACISNLVQSEKVLAKARLFLGKEPQLVRVILFDKTPDKNWLVSWHQDKTVSVNKKQDIDGWGPWTVKDGIHHVQPSVDALNDMIAFRVHLDDSNAQNGCLKVVPDSHLLGVLRQGDIDDVVNRDESIECEAKAGDMLIMNPLILHASSKAISPNHRRVIHIEFSGHKLPDGLSWE